VIRTHTTQLDLTQVQKLSISAAQSYLLPGHKAVTCSKSDDHGAVS